MKLSAQIADPRKPPHLHLRTPSMLYMVIESFRSTRPDEVGTRFRAQGRLMPEGAGLEYVASWMAADGSRCYQLMNAPSREAFNGWIANWSDLVDFEVIEVNTSADFWANRQVTQLPHPVPHADAGFAAAARDPSNLSSQPVQHVAAPAE